MRSDETLTPYSIVTPSLRHSVNWLRIMSPNSARFGTDAASRTCPPACRSFSYTVTLIPLRAAAIAACNPPGPAPTTTTVRRDEG